MELPRLNRYLLKPGGNGTGPGTPYPKRTGPKPGPRRDKRIPDYMRTIELKIGDRWHGPTTGDLEYLGGWTHYIHNVDPEDFQLSELCLAIEMLLLEPILPSRFWYHAYTHPEANPPVGLKPLDSYFSMVQMWENCDAHSRRIVRTYGQDAEYRTYPEGNNIRSVYYSLSDRVPRVSRSFNAHHHYTEASELHELRLQHGARELARKEAFGETWYIDTAKKPRVPLQQGDFWDFATSDSYMMPLNNPLPGKFEVVGVSEDELDNTTDTPTVRVKVEAV